MATDTYPCKGAGTEKCPNTVTYVRVPVFAVTRLDSLAAHNTAEKVASKRVFLSCVLGHSNPYTVDAAGHIVG
jgi:hypothetical protein